MLPSQAFQALARREIVAVVRRAAPGSAELRGEFGIPFLNSWVVVLDGKGETLASWVGDAAGAGCDRRSADTFARNLAAWIRRSLRRQESVQELERRWRGNRRDRAAFDQLAGRLQEMHAFGRLRQLCEEAAATPRLGRRRREEFRLRAFVARASDPTGELSARRDRARFLRDGERLLVTLADHPRAVDLVQALFSSGYAHGFDVPSRSARGLARLRRAAGKLANAGPLEGHIRRLAALRQEWIDHMTEFLGRLEDAPTRDFIAAGLGDARAAIRLFSQPAYRQHPEYRERLEEAEKKTEQQRKRSGRVR